MNTFLFVMIEQIEIIIILSVLFFVPCKDKAFI